MATARTSAHQVNASSGSTSSSRRSKAGAGGLLLGALALILGLWLKSHFDLTNALCNTGLGAFGQAVSSTAAHDCTVAGAAVAFGELLVWVGVLVCIAGALGLIAAVVGALSSTPSSTGRGSASRSPAASQGSSTASSPAAPTRDRPAVSSTASTFRPA